MSARDSAVGLLDAKPLLHHQFSVGHLADVDGHVLEVTPQDTAGSFHHHTAGLYIDLD